MRMIRIQGVRCEWERFVFSRPDANESHSGARAFL